MPIAEVGRRRNGAFEKTRHKITNRSVLQFPFLADDICVQFFNDDGSNPTPTYWYEAQTTGIAGELQHLVVDRFGTTHELAKPLPPFQVVWRYAGANVPVATYIERRRNTREPRKFPRDIVTGIHIDGSIIVIGPKPFAKKHSVVPADAFVRVLAWDPVPVRAGVYRFAEPDHYLDRMINRWKVE